MSTLNLTGSRLGCGIGICHACTRDPRSCDGRSEEWRTCITGAHFFDGKSVRTIEGHAQRNAKGEVGSSRRCSRRSSRISSSSAATARRASSTAATVLIERAASALRSQGPRWRRRLRAALESAHLPLHRLRALLPGGARRDPGDPRPDEENA